MMNVKQISLNTLVFILMLCGSIFAQENQLPYAYIACRGNHNQDHLTFIKEQKLAGYNPWIHLQISQDDYKQEWWNLMFVKNYGDKINTSFLHNLYLPVKISFFTSKNDQQIVYLNPVSLNIENLVDHRGHSEQLKRSIIQEYKVFYEKVFSRHLVTNEVYNFTLEWIQLPNLVLGQSSVMSNVLAIRYHM